MAGGTPPRSLKHIKPTSFRKAERFFIACPILINAGIEGTKHWLSEEGDQSFKGFLIDFLLTKTFKFFFVIRVTNFFRQLPSAGDIHFILVKKRMANLIQQIVRPSI